MVGASVSSVGEGLGEGVGSSDGTPVGRRVGMSNMEGKLEGSWVRDGCEDTVGELPGAKIVGV